MRDKQAREDIEKIASELGMECEHFDNGEIRLRPPNHMFYNTTADKIKRLKKMLHEICAHVGLEEDPNPRADPPILRKVK